MNIFKKRMLWAVALAPFFLSNPVLAHVIWFEQINNNQQEILFGHPEESQPEPLVIEKFQEASAYDANKDIIPHTTYFVDGRLFVNTTTALAAERETSCLEGRQSKLYSSLSFDVILQPIAANLH